jgi:hypothetical protein
VQRLQFQQKRNHTAAHSSTVGAAKAVSTQLAIQVVIKRFILKRPEMQPLQNTMVPCCADTLGLEVLPGHVISLGRNRP